MDSNFSDFFSFIKSGGGGGATAPAQANGGAAGLTTAHPPGPAAMREHSSSGSLDLSSPTPRTPASSSDRPPEMASGDPEEDDVNRGAAGVDITSASFTYAMPTDASLLPHLRCTPIAFYNSEPRMGPGGRLIAVSDDYICYAIKEGHIRVINRHTVVRTLLKGHKKPILDAVFASQSSNILATLGGDGALIIWKISEGEDQEGNRLILHEMLLHVSGMPLSRLVWHPSRPTVLAVGRPNEVALIDYQQVLSRLNPADGGHVEVTSLSELSMNEWHISAHQGPVLDLSFSKDGRYLITAGADGWARVWEVDSKNAVGRWQPYGGEPVSRALFLHRTTGPTTGETVFVATGGRADTQIKLWRSWTSLAPVQTQLLTMAGGEEGTQLQLRMESDASGSSFLFLADYRSPVLYAAHVSLTPSTARLDRLTPFQLKHPVLSFLTLAADATNAHLGSAGPSDGVEVQLYCIQTQAIQIYHCRPSDCISPTPPPVTVPAAPVQTTTTTSAASSSPTAATTTAAPSAPSAVGPPIPEPAPPAVASPIAEPPAPAPAPPAPAPAEAKPRSGILHMLLSSASRSSSRVGGGAAEASAAPAPVVQPAPLPSGPAVSGEATAGGDGAKDEAGEEAARGLSSEESLQSVASSVVEEKQTGGARTTEQAMPPAPRPSLPGEPSSSGAAPARPPPVDQPRVSPPLPPPPSEAKSAVSAPPPVPAPAAKQLASSSDATAASRSLPSSQAKPSAPSAGAGGAGEGGGVSKAGAGGGVVQQDGLLAELIVSRNMLAQLVEGQQQLSQQMDARIKKSVNEALVKIAPDLQRSVSNAVTPKVEAAVRSAVATHVEALPQQINASLAGAGEILSASVKEPVMSTFRQCFTDQLIPAFQTATQKMFQQIAEALNKGIASRTAAGSAETKQEVAALRQDLQDLMASVQTLAGEVRGLSAKLDSMSTAGAALGAASGGGLDGSGSGAKDGGQAGGVSDAKAALRALVRASKYDEAMKQALAASNLELVIWLCKELPRDHIFAADPPLLSQAALLCLLQQLTFALERDTMLKLEWLHEIMLVLNVADPEIAAFVRDIARESQTNLDRFGTELQARGNANPDTVKELRYLQRSVRKLSET